MPTKRRRRAVRQLGRLTDVQRMHLACGSYLLVHDPAEEFVSEEHRRAAWEEHRADILAEWDMPGQRPAAVWQYDAKLRRAPYPKKWAWPRPITTEAWMVYELIKAGQLEQCRFSGTNPIASELAEIESWWARMISCPGAGYPHEVPRWFYRANAARLQAEAEAERAKWYASLPGRGNGAAA
jgi:hypothetical protein